MTTRNIIDNLDWLSFLSRLTRVEKTAQWILDQPDDPRHGVASEILKTAASIRRAHKRGWATAHNISKLEQLCTTADAEITGELVKRGLAFSEGPKKQRLDALGKLIVTALDELGRKASAREVLDYLKKNGSGVIDEVDDDDTIFWRRGSGKEETMPFSTFNNRVSAYRKK